VRVRGALVAVALVLVSAACSAPVTSSSANLRRADLDAIVLSASDAPSGTRYVEEVSGYQDIQTFAIDADELNALREDGFVVGHLAWFIPENHDSLSEPLSNDDVLIQGITGLFAAPDGADAALRRFLDNLRNEQLATHRDLDASALGDEAFALEGTVPSGAPVVAFLLRRANLVLAVAGQGDVDVDLLRGMAEVLDERATKEAVGPDSEAH
jgi:hypothetical protein